MANGFLSEIFCSFQGEGIHAGRRQLFIRLAGCNLRCRYCDTPDSLERVPSFRVNSAGGIQSHANPVTPAAVHELVADLLRDEPPIDGVALTGGEPLMQPEFLDELLADDRIPHPRLLETSGMLPDALRRLLPAIDCVSMDIKLPSNSGERPLWDLHARFLATAGAKATVKVLVDAGTTADDVARAAQLVGEIAPTAPLFLQPITQAEGGVDIGAAALARHFAAVRRHVDDVRVLPQTHKMMGIP